MLRIASVRPVAGYYGSGRETLVCLHKLRRTSSLLELQSRY
jgi:hypothetical protein